MILFLWRIIKLKYIFVLQVESSALLSFSSSLRIS